MRKLIRDRISLTTEEVSILRSYMTAITMKVLFNSSGEPYSTDYVKKCMKDFSLGYSITVCDVIKATENGIDKYIFFKNVSKLMANFKMTRSGPFKGIRFLDGRIIDPEGRVAACWDAIGEYLIEVINILNSTAKGDRSRVLVEMPDSIRALMVSKLWGMFKRLLPICISKTSWGLVAASKILFSVLPELALPVDNNQWKTVFKTVDYGDIVSLMANEIIEWEKQVSHKLNECDSNPISTLPVIYNVMAMKARSI